MQPRMLVIAMLALPLGTAFLEPALAIAGPTRRFTDPGPPLRTIVMTEGPNGTGTITTPTTTYPNLRLVDTGMPDTLCWMASFSSGRYHFYFKICLDTKRNTWSYTEVYAEDGEKPEDPKNIIQMWVGPLYLEPEPQPGKIR